MNKIRVCYGFVEHETNLLEYFPTKNNSSIRSSAMNLNAVQAKTTKNPPSVSNKERVVRITHQHNLFALYVLQFTHRAQSDIMSVGTSCGALAIFSTIFFFPNDNEFADRGASSVEYRN